MITSLLHSSVFTIGYLSASWLISKNRPKSLEDKYVKEWDNTLTSFIHSFVSSVMFCLVIYNDYITPSFLFVQHPNQQILFDSSFLLQITLTHTIGYMQCDLIMFIINGWYKTSRKAMTIHHILVILCFSLAAYMNIYYPILVLTLIAELNSIFMHSRKLCGLINRRDSIIYSISAFFLIVSYIPCRVIAHSWITYQVFMLSSSFLASYHYYIAFNGMLIISCLNILFLYQFLALTDVLQKAIGLFSTKSKLPK